MSGVDVDSLMDNWDIVDSSSSLDALRRAARYSTSSSLMVFPSSLDRDLQNVPWTFDGKPFLLV